VRPEFLPVRKPFPKGAVISLLCTVERYVPRILGAVGNAQQVVRARTWDELARHAATCGCSIIVMEWLLNARELDEFRRFRRLFPSQPTVLITQEDAENARRLAGLAVDEVLWLREIEQRLYPAVARVRATRSVACVADVLDRAERLPARLRGALRDACLSQHPPRSVCRLAATAGCHRSTLWLQWRQAVAEQAGEGRPALRLEDFLDWLLLLSAVERKAPRLKWAEVAQDVGVHEHTMARLARRLTGLTLRDLENRGCGKILDHFSGTVLPRVVGHALQLVPPPSITAGSWSSGAARVSSPRGGDEGATRRTV
jgi:AraC-like DNA-binding protein/predicted nucleic acid-binding protein